MCAGLTTFNARATAARGPATRAEIVHNLLGGPRSGRMRGDVEVQKSAAMVSEDDQDREHAAGATGVTVVYLD